MSKQEVVNQEKAEVQNVQQDQEKKNFVEQLNKTVRKGFESMNADLNGVKEAVVVIGDTGVGKSTLINALIGKQLEVVNYGEGMVEKLVLQIVGDSASNSGDHTKESGKTVVDAAEVGHDISVTKIPKGWKANGVVYFDCPGFGDTRGEVQDIANSIFINKLFTSLDKVKIVLVFSSDQFKEARNISLNNLLTKVTAVFQDQPQIKGSLSMVVSKVDNKQNANSVIKGMMWIMKENEKNPESTTFHDKPDKGPVTLNAVGQMWELLMKSNICVFKAPTEEGTYNFDQKIRESIEKTTYAEKVTPKLVVSSKSENKLREVFKEIREKIDNELDNLLKDSKAVVSHCASEVEKLSLLKKIDGNVSALRMNKMKEELDQNDLSRASSTIDELHQILGVKQNNVNPLVAMFLTLKSVLGRTSKFNDEKISENLGKLDNIVRYVDDEIENSKKKVTEDTVNSLKSMFSNIDDKTVASMSKEEKDKLKDTKVQNFGDIEKVAAIFGTSLDAKTKADLGVMLKNAKDIGRILLDPEVGMTIVEVAKQKIELINTKIDAECAKSETKLIEIKLEKQKKQGEIKDSIQSSYDYQCVKGCKEENALWVTGNGLSVAASRISSFYDFKPTPPLTSKPEESTYLRHGKYTFVFGVTAIEFNSDITMRSGHLIVCAPTIRFGSNVKFDLHGINGNDYRDFTAIKADSGSWDSHGWNANIATGVGIGFGGVVAKGIVMSLGAVAAPVVAPAVVVGGGIIAAVGALGTYGTKKVYDANAPKDEKEEFKTGSYANAKGGKDGSYGKGGEPGYPGGRLIMFAKKYEGLEKLKVDVSGGNGGDGQDGGDGASCNESYLTAPKGRTGGNGGDGGNAGRGALKGFVKVYQVDDNKKPSITLKVNVKEEDGKDGTPGKGGEGGKGWKGTIFESGKDGESGKNGVISTKEIKEFDRVCGFTEIEIQKHYNRFVKHSPIKYLEFMKEFLKNEDYVLPNGVETLGDNGYESFISE